MQYKLFVMSIQDIWRRHDVLKDTVEKELKIKMLSLNNFSFIDKGTMPPCSDDDRSTKKVRMRERFDRLISVGEDVSVTNLGENMEACGNCSID